jgi:hypothetical protein
VQLLHWKHPAWFSESVYQPIGQASHTAFVVALQLWAIHWPAGQVAQSRHAVIWGSGANVWLAHGIGAVSPCVHASPAGHCSMVSGSVQKKPSGHGVCAVEPL